MTLQRVWVHSRAGSIRLCPGARGWMVPLIPPCEGTVTAGDRGILAQTGWGTLAPRQVSLSWADPGVNKQSCSKARHDLPEAWRNSLSRAVRLRCQESVQSTHVAETQSDLEQLAETRRSIRGGLNTRWTHSWP